MVDTNNWFTGSADDIFRASTAFPSVASNADETCPSAGSCPQLSSSNENVILTFCPFISIVLVSYTVSRMNVLLSVSCCVEMVIFTSWKLLTIPAGQCCIVKTQFDVLKNVG